MVHEHLYIGSDHTMTGRQLADILHCDIRTISTMVERERRAGIPICAKPRGTNKGYFLAETQEDVVEYCKQLRHRAGEIFKTRRELLKAAEKLPTKEDLKADSQPK